MELLSNCQEYKYLFEFYVDFTFKGWKFYMRVLSLIRMVKAI